MGSFWDERYSEDGFAYGEHANDFLRQVTPRLPRGRALCLAEGEGRNAVWLAQHGFEVTAMDQSPVGLAKATQLAAQRGVTISTAVADLSNYAMGTSCYQVVVAIWCHLPKPLLKQVLRNSVAALVPGGALVMESYTPAQLTLGTGGPQQVEMLQSLVELKEGLEGMDVAVGVEGRRHIDEGKYHRGDSATVQLLAFKR